MRILLLVVALLALFSPSGAVGSRHERLGQGSRWADSEMRGGPGSLTRRLLQGQTQPGGRQAGTGAGGEGWDKGGPKESDEELVRRVFGSDRRYYWVVGGGDRCMGEGHFSFSLACLLTESRFLHRTLVLDTEVCIDSAHNQGLELLRPMELYYNLDRLFAVYPGIAQTEFKRAMEAQKLLTKPPPVTWGMYNYSSSTLDLLQDKQATVVTRMLASTEWAFGVCNKESDLLNNDYASWLSLGHADALNGIVDAIVGALQGDFDSVHVRRGDKVDPRFYPNLDRDTQPESLLKRLPELIPRGRVVYISTDERTPGFFDPLKEVYQVFLLDDFAYLWNETSAWYQFAHPILGDQTSFDPRMRVIVEYKVVSQGKRKVETFNDLTADSKYGIGRGVEAKKRSAGHRRGHDPG